MWVCFWVLGCLICFVVVCVLEMCNCLIVLVVYVSLLLELPFVSIAGCHGICYFLDYLLFTWVL